MVDKVIMEVSREWEVSPEEIKGRTRNASIVTARQVAMYILRELTDMSLPEIGKPFGGKDHSTVHHSIRLIEERVQNESRLKARIDEVIKNVKNR